MFCKVFLVALLLTAVNTYSSNGQIVVGDNFSKEIIIEKTMVLQANNAISDDAVYLGQQDERFTPFDYDQISGADNQNWFRFSIKNNSAQEADLFIGGNDFEETTLFSKGLAIHKVEFPLVSFFNIHLQPNEERVYYLKGVNKSMTTLPRVHFPLQLLSSERFTKEYEDPVWHTYIALGGVLILALYHLFLFIVTRDRSYLFYVLFVAMISIFGLGLVPQFAESLFGEMVPTRGLPTFLGLASLICNISFFRSIFDIKHKFPKWDRIFVYIILLGVVSLLLNYFGLNLISTFINIPIALVASVLMAWLNFRLLKDGTLSPYFFFAGYVIFSLSTMILVAMLLGLVPSIFLGLTFSGQLQLLFSIAFVLLATALGSRINQMKKNIISAELAKERILREQEASKRQILKSQNKVLEDTVAERIKELQEQSTALETSIDHLKATQVRLVESEKMASLGQLTAGVAHEINNPINFVANGVSNLKQNYADLNTVLHGYLSLAPDDVTADSFRSAIEKGEELDIQYAIEEVETLFKSINNGVNRMTKIAKGLSSFSSDETGAMEKSDINQNLESTIEILKNNLKDRIEITKNFGELPPVYCQEGKINQVFLNIINNAGQAIEGQGNITINTEYQKTEERVLIEVIDNGTGMTEEVRKKIFDPFFTTKEVGVGTGLGLSITYGIIEEHKGQIEVESEVGRGSKFSIYLPVNEPD